MSKNVINSVSYPVEMQQFLDDNPDLSLSKMIQSKIIEVRENRKLNTISIDKLKVRVNFMEKKLWEANDEIDKLKEKNAKLVQQKD